VVVSSDTVQYYKFKNADAIPVFLSVYTKYGCRSDTIDVVYIKPAPHPNFTLNIIDSCLNSNSITLKNTSVADSLETPRFKWYFSEGYVLSNSNPKAPRSYVDPGKYYIDLIYSYANKCIDTFRKDLTIYMHPKTNFSFKEPFCKGSATQFFDSSSSDYRPLKYQWQFGDLSTATDSAPQHIYNKKGYYQVNLKTTSPQGCSDSTYKTVVVYNPPTANFTINDSIQCLVSNQFQFKSTASADSSQLSLLNWRFGDNTKDTGRTPANKVYASAQTFTITHMVRDARGCKDSVAKTVLVQNGPISDFRINNTSQCENLQNFQFTYVPKVGNDSIIELQWTINGNTYLNQANVNLTNLPLGKTAVDLILKTTEGCPGLTTKQVVVNPKPKANFTINAAVQCFDGHAFDYTNTSSISSGSISTHYWTLGDNTTYTGLNPATKTYNAAGTYQIQLAIRSDSACVDTLSQSITINPNPIVDIDLVDAVCLNNPSVFKNKSSISSGSIVAYDWDFGDLNTSNAIDPSHTYANAGIYNIGLKAISDKGCTSANVFANHVNVFALPIAKFNYVVAEGDKDDHLFQFKNNSSPSGLNSRWNFGKFGIARIDTSISIIDTATIPVQLIVKDNNGCADTVQQIIAAYGPLRVFFPTAFTPNDNGLNETFAPGGVIAYQSYDFSIFNRWGEKVFESDAVNKAWDGTYHNAPCMDGVYVYVLKLVDANGRLKIYRGAFTLLK
jgi:gliding motility-associated-like protein